MTAEDILRRCLQKPHAYLDFPFGDSPGVVKVGVPPTGRILLQVLGGARRGQVTLRCTPATGEVLRELYPGTVARGWHCPPVQAPFFNTFAAPELPDDLVARLIDEAYSEAKKRLPKNILTQMEETDARQDKIRSQ